MRIPTPLPVMLLPLLAVLTLSAQQPPPPAAGKAAAPVEAPGAVSG